MTAWEREAKRAHKMAADRKEVIRELLAACEAVCGVFEGQEDVPLYVRKCRDALVRAKGEQS